MIGRRRYTTRIKQSESPYWKRLLWQIPTVLIYGFASFTVWAVVTSGVMPAKYSAVLVACLAVLVIFTIWLFWRRFYGRWLNRLAKVFATIILLLALVSSILGYHVFRSGIALLSDITSPSQAVDVETDQSFNIFISGIDTYGDVAAQSRSDVNIVATVNPKTHKILLTTVPRDSYVQIPLGGNDQYDKLTHAGNYSVEASMGAVANLLEQEIDAYVRINFTSFIESVDKLGGVTVYNPVAFDSGKHHFKAGDIHLTGEQALVFSRERKSLKQGDVSRADNQQRVIQGIVSKMSEIRSINGYNALLAMLGKSVQTNMSQQAIKALIRQQLSSNPSWKTESYTLKGRGETGTRQSYAMPDAQLYMYILDENSVDTARSRIRSQLNGL